MALAAGLYLVPLQVGAAEIAGPRVALAGLWLLISGGITMWCGFLTSGGAAQASWWGFDPLSDRALLAGQPAWTCGSTGSCWRRVAEMLWAGCVIATALRRRAPGMTLMRMPVFTWTMVVTCLMVLFAFPALLVALGLLWAQRHLGGVLVGNGGAVAYQELFWFYGHPVVYVMFFPFIGMVAEMLATFSSRRFFGYPAFVVALLAFSGLSMTVWGHHMFTFGQTTNKYFSLTSTALIVPPGIEYFDFLAHDLERRAAVHDRVPVRARVPRPVPRRRADRRDPRLTAAGLRAEHVLLRRRALPLHDLRRQRLRPVRRHLLLVPEADRA